MTEEQIKNEITARLGIAEEKVRVVRRRRMSAELTREEFEKVFPFAREHLGFNHLITITGLDEQDKLGLIYHLSSDSGIVLNLKFSVEKAQPVLGTVIGIFPGAEIYERELVDLFGAKVEGLPEGPRYPLADDWPAGQFPLRKDWKQQD